MGFNSAFKGLNCTVQKKVHFIVSVSHGNFTAEDVCKLGGIPVQQYATYPNAFHPDRLGPSGKHFRTVIVPLLMA